MEKHEKKTQSDLEPTIVNKGDNQRAGYGGRNLPKQHQEEE